MSSRGPEGHVGKDALVAERRTALRRTTLHLFAGVAAVHGVFFLLYYAFDIADRPTQSRTIFVGLWTFATALTVAFLLRRVRAVRRMGMPPVRRKD
jgi:hypothetical protein